MPGPIRRLALALAPILVLWAGLAGQAALAAPAPACAARTFEGRRFTVCTIDLREAQVRLYWKQPDGEPIGTFARLRETPSGARLLFAMNAGMYHEDRSPVGLYIEEGRVLKRASTANGPGNFHLKPNGVFYVAGESAGILETGRFLKQRPKADYATQSGPMLVIEGAIHPKISAEGISRKIRNGVGVKDRRIVSFAISDEPVTFGEFARLFRDDLGCPDALFLDGSISSLDAPGLNRSDLSLPMGPIVGALPR